MSNSETPNERRRANTKRAGRRWHYVGRWNGGRSRSRTLCGLPALRLNRPVGEDIWEHVTCLRCLSLAWRAGHFGPGVSSW